MLYNVPSQSQAVTLWRYHCLFELTEICSACGRLILWWWAPNISFFFSYISGLNCQQKHYGENQKQSRQQNRSGRVRKIEPSAKCYGADGYEKKGCQQKRERREEKRTGMKSRAVSKNVRGEKRTGMKNSAKLQGF